MVKLDENEVVERAQKLARTTNFDALDQGLQQLEQEVLHKRRDTAGMVRVCEVALASVTDLARQMILLFWVVCGLRRLDDEPSVQRTERLLAILAESIEEVEDRLQKNRLLRLLHYNSSIFDRKWGRYADAVEHQRWIVAHSDGWERAIAQYLVEICRTMQAFVEGKVLGMAFIPDLRTALQQLHTDLKGTSKEVVWGNGPGELHLLQALTVAHAAHDEFWAAHLAVFFSAESTFGPQCRSWAALFRAGTDIHALQRVVEDKATTFDARGAALFTIARELAADPSRRDTAPLAFADAAKPGPEWHWAVAVVRREAAALRAQQ